MTDERPATETSGGQRRRLSPLRRDDRVKRQLLRDVVEDNLETINGEPKGSRRRNRSQRLAKVKQWLLGGTGALVVLAVVVLWIGSGSRAGSAPSREAATVRVAAAVEQGMLDPSSPAGLQRLTELLARRGPEPLEPDVVPLAVRRVVVDPGHGGRDGGTLTPYGMLEKDLTWDIAYRLRELLEAASLEVVMTRDGDEAVSLSERAAIANSARGDIFVSIHVNWLPDKEARGAETYCVGATDDPFVRGLAAAENRDSGFSLADYRDLLDGLYADVRQAHSRRLATGIQQALYRTLKEENQEVVDRGVMTAPFVVLVATDMPAVLAEVSCLSNDREARLLAIPRYRQRIAEALFDGISAYAATVDPSVPRVASVAQGVSSGG